MGFLSLQGRDAESTNGPAGAILSPIHDDIVVKMLSQPS